MSAGSITGGIVTLFGAIAGGALVAQGISPDLPVQPVAAWIIFILCFGGGVLMLLMFARTSATPAAMQLPGALALLLGLVSGGVALAKVIGVLPPGHSASLWAMFVITLLPGVLLLHGASALNAQAAK